MVMSTQASLTMVALNTNTPLVYWDGVKVENITRITVDWDGDDKRVKLRVSSIDPALQAAMVAGGVAIKVGV